MLDQIIETIKECSISDMYISIIFVGILLIIIIINVIRKKDVFNIIFVIILSATTCIILFSITICIELYDTIWAIIGITISILLTLMIYTYERNRKMSVSKQEEIKKNATSKHEKALKNEIVQKLQQILKNLNDEKDYLYMYYNPTDPNNESISESYKNDIKYMQKKHAADTEYSKTLSIMAHPVMGTKQVLELIEICTKSAIPYILDKRDDANGVERDLDNIYRKINLVENMLKDTFNENLQDPIK